MKNYSILDILETFVDITYVEKGNVAIVCPFHEDTNPSLHVSLEHGGFHCFSCDAHGGFAKLYAKLANISISDAYDRLNCFLSASNTVQLIQKQIFSTLNPDEDKEVYLKWKVFSSMFKPITQSERGLSYLHSRNITDMSIYKSFHIRYATEGKYRDRVVLPIFDVQNRLISFTARTIIPNVLPKTRKARSPHATLFGLKELLDIHGTLKTILIVEGEFDCLFLQQLGYPAVSAMGTSDLSKFQQYLLLHYVTNTVYLCYDGDKAGEKAAKRNAQILRSFITTRTIQLPDQIDPNDLTVKEARSIFGDSGGYYA
jgi:DNA primase